MDTPYKVVPWLIARPMMTAPLLSIKFGEDGKVILHCFAECLTESIFAALELSSPDLFVPKSTASAKTEAKND